MGLHGLQGQLQGLQGNNVHEMKLIVAAQDFEQIMRLQGWTPVRPWVQHDAVMGRDKSRGS